MEKVCPRSGYLRLAHGDHDHTMPTACKTWSCKVCAPKVKALVAMRLQYGLQMGANSWFIVLTYRMAYDAMLKGAASAGRDMAQFWRVVEADLGERPAWFRVPELTMKGQVHHHVMMTTQAELTDSCRKKTERYLTWKRNGCRVSKLRSSYDECMEHKFSRLWEGVTGDSFVVHVSRVRSVARSATYISKYLSKSWDNREAMAAMGYKRRWSRSRNWPGGYALRLAGTVDGAWEGLRYISNRKIDSKFRGMLEQEIRRNNSRGCEAVQQVGTDLALELFGGGREKQALEIVRRFAA